MEDSFEAKCEKLKKIFSPLPKEARYQKIMELGKSLPPFPEQEKVSNNLISGCQSRLYVTKTAENGKLFFNAHSDALISLGLAAILVEIYSGETPETILTLPPTFLSELEMQASLSLSRSNGFTSIYLRLKQLALQELIKK